MKKAVIAGAGPAGITAGLELLRKSKDYEVVILEESGSVGGISRTVNHNGNRMDIGGHRFFSKDESVNRFWEELMPVQGRPSSHDSITGRQKELKPGGPDPEKEDRVMLVRQRVSRIYYLNKFFDYPISLKPQTFINMGFSRTVKSGLSYLHSCAVKRDENSLEDFYINRFGKTLYSMFFEGYTEKLWGRHPSQISADWGAQRVKGLSIAAVIKDVFSKLVPAKQKEVETSLIEQFVYPKYGPGQLWETAALEFEKLGGKIIKNCKVEKTVVSDGKVSEFICSLNGETVSFDGDVFFSSMPIKDLVAGMNGVPVNIGEIASGLPYRDFVTVGLLVDRLKLINKTKIPTPSGTVPDCWIYVQDTGVKLGRIQIFNNWSPYLVKDPRNTVWIGLEYFCNEGDDFWNMSENECVEFAVGELKKMGVIDEKTVPADFHRERVKKAYPAYFDTYKDIDKVISYLDGIENLYCIGRNGQHRYNNMDHSMVTAFEAVSNIVSGKKTKENIWNVNTEAQYHEESK